MKIQSLSLAVPAGCINDCKFCVAKIHRGTYVNQLDCNKPFYDLYLEDYERRLQFARDNGCNIVMITGDGEPLLNRRYLETFSMINKKMQSPFRWIELQTSGVTLDRNYLRFLRNTVWVNTISLSLSDIFSSSNNALINGTKQGFEIDIDELCGYIKEYDFTLRLSLNMTDTYDNSPVDKIFERAKQLHADQITFRVLYFSNKNTVEDKWIKKHKCGIKKINEINSYIKKNGNKLRKLEFGASVYSVNGMSVVLDDDCMGADVKDSNIVKYLILRPDCKLYSHWDDTGSLIF